MSPALYTDIIAAISHPRTFAFSFRLLMAVVWLSVYFKGFLAVYANHLVALFDNFDDGLGTVQGTVLNVLYGIVNYRKLFSNLR